MLAKLISGQFESFELKSAPCEGEFEATLCWPNPDLRCHCVVASLRSSNSKVLPAKTGLRQLYAGRIRNSAAKVTLKPYVGKIQFSAAHSLVANLKASSSKVIPTKNNLKPLYAGRIQGPAGKTTLKQLYAGQIQSSAADCLVSSLEASSSKVRHAKANLKRVYSGNIQNPAARQF